MHLNLFLFILFFICHENVKATSTFSMDIFSNNECSGISKNITVEAGKCYTDAELCQQFNTLGIYNHTCDQDFAKRYLQMPTFSIRYDCNETNFSVYAFRGSLDCSKNDVMPLAQLKPISKECNQEGSFFVKYKCTVDPNNLVKNKGILNSLSLSILLIIVVFHSI